MLNNCEAQARVRQGSARDGSQRERPQSLNPSLELTLKLVVTHPPTTISLILLNYWPGSALWAWMVVFSKSVVLTLRR